MALVVMAHINYNDGVLFVSLLYSSFDIRYEWQSFSSCYRPIHAWLLASYGTVIVFRLAHVLGTMHTPVGVGNFLLNLRQKKAVPKCLVSFTWLVALPFFALWTILGTFWLHGVLTHTPDCMPSETHRWFLIFWQILSYAWLIIHGALGWMALALERRLRSAERDLQLLATPDVIARWGEDFSSLPGYSSLPDAGCDGTQRLGLSPAEINEILPVAETWTGSSVMSLRAGGDSGQRSTQDKEDCAICLSDFKKGESTRSLLGCGHTFHTACVDLWLLRRADCPLCKRDVRAGAGQA